MTTDLSYLTIAEIREILLRNGVELPRFALRTKNDLLTYIREHVSINIVRVMEYEAEEKRRRRTLVRKRGEFDEDSPSKRKESRRWDGFQSVKERDEYDSEKYLENPTADEVKSCYRSFFEGTSNKNLKLAVCGVCGREASVEQEDITVLPLEDIPNPHRLQPHQSHPAHDLVEGKLLAREGLYGTDHGVMLHVCRRCRESLQSSKEDRPRFSLANNMWIGEIPNVVATLTFSEQLLLSHVYPRVYVFKLYPKKGFGGDGSKLQSAMRGTVSTFDLDMEGIASMIEGNLMPRSPSVLASVISVTYIGLGRLPKNWLRGLFRVRRNHVWQALCWMKTNNQKYYGDIKIDPVRLSALPEDDIPVEVLSIVRQCKETGVVDQESSGYVPQDEDGKVSNAGECVDGGDEVDLENVTMSYKNGEEDEPCVVPLQVSGSIDVDMSKLNANELMSWGLANLWNTDKEGAYAVRYGGRAVSDFGRPRRGEVVDPNRDNYFEKAFPCLFPYGRGGIEADREIEVDFLEHIRWCLQYHDRRFRRHETFSFVAFGIHQRRQALCSARLQMQRKLFDQEARSIATITTERLERACEEESHGKRITDPAVRILQRNVYTALSRINGSNQSRLQLRSQIWSTCIMKNPATLWITINPSDIQDPIAQVFAGENVNMDAFLASQGPNGDERAYNIAQDPYAAAKFFHFLIRVILETLFGIKITEFQVYNKPGILGRVSAYFGTVESQGRGTLHFHVLVWLENAPQAGDIKSLLQSSSFRSQVAVYIQQNLRAYVPGLESAESVKAIPREGDIAYSRPIHPDEPCYGERLRDFELRLARSEQIHTCRKHQCLVQDKDGTYYCKRRAPFPLSEADGIDERGDWFQKRLYGYVNGWVPGILVNARCNNDGKLLTNGPDTKKVARYTTTYVAKKQNKSYNASAVMAKTYAYHLDHLGGSTDYLDDVRDTQRLLVFRLVNALNGEQELAAPMVISYLMGWGDSYRSHHYSPIYWTSFVKTLLKSFPDLRLSGQDSKEDDTRTTEEENKAESSANGQQEVERSSDGYSTCKDKESDFDPVQIDISSGGTIYVKSQVTDYVTRGDRLTSFNVVDFFTNTYERKVSHSEDEQLHEGGQTSQETMSSRQRGRPCNEHVRYLTEHPKWKNMERVIRSQPHNNLPNFVGQKFPRKDNEDTYDFYCASMLLLLKPWRNLLSDLKEPDETWTKAYDRFYETTSREIQGIISGIGYLHDCEDAIEKDSDNSNSQNDNMEGGRETGIDLDDDFEREDDSEGMSGEQNTMTTYDDLKVIIRAQTSLKEEIHGRMAIEYGKRAKIFESEIDDGIWMVGKDDARVGNANNDDLGRLGRWRTQLKEEATRMNDIMGDVANDEDIHFQQRVDTNVRWGLTSPDVVIVKEIMSAETAQFRTATNMEVLTPTDPSMLNDDQKRAYDLILRHLDDNLQGNNPPPLRMIIHGEGGTGKSKVLQTVTEGFKNRRCEHLLVKAAYTGVAASLIEGKTTHMIGGVSGKNGRFNVEDVVSDEMRTRLAKIWHHRQYLAIDEMSMLSKDFFAVLARNIGIGKGNMNSQSFGGISVIILGDFHQFPPVARPIRDALYYPMDVLSDSLSAKIGRATYEEFSTVVVLKEQKRIRDPIWLDFLQHLRIGEVDKSHVQMLRSLIINTDKSSRNEGLSSSWNDASLVTPRHGVRTLWNEAGLRKMCKQKQKQIFVCTAEDCIRGRSVTIKERCILEAHRGRRNRGGRMGADLVYQNEVAIGMKVMVTNNIETDLDIANGVRGEIVDIVLHPDEPSIDTNDCIVTLKFLPAYILVKLSRTRAGQLDGLEEGIIPVEPIVTSYRIKVPVDGKIVQRTVERKQYPLTGAYAFTDYRAQGQTIPYVLVDIASPPSGGLNLFNLYVALSRSSGRDTIRLLRDFDERYLMMKQNEAVLKEDDRLEVLNNETLLWYENAIGPTSL